MKRNFLKTILLASAGAFILAGSSCKKLEDFGDTNVNPNGSPDVLTNALLTNVLAGISGTVADLNTGQYSQIFAEPTYPGNSLYTIPRFNMSGTYSGPLMDLQVIINKNTDPATAPTAALNGPNNNQIGIARILKAYYFWTLTDRWGDIPYSEALKGTANLNPKYDEQEFIYKDLLKELTEAKDQLTVTPQAIKGDIAYGGDVTKWQKLANSLRMLISMRMSNVYPAPGGLAATEFAAAFDAPEGSISTNADNFTITYPGGSFRNPFYTLGLALDNRVSKTITDLMGALGDTRATAFFSNTTGVPYGLSNAAPVVSYGKILSDTWAQINSPVVVINAASTWLAIAEARQRGWIPGDAKQAYEMGVTLSFQQWNVTMPGSYLSGGLADFESGAGVTATNIGGPTVAGTNANTAEPPYTDAQAKLRRIWLQQYLAFYPNGIQTWSNWRRTGVPDLKPTINAVAGDGIIRRYVYGTVEQSSNSAQLAIAVARIPGGVDDQDARMWWDRP
jgi:hypothetical protein